VYGVEGARLLNRLLHGTGEATKSIERDQDTNETDERTVELNCCLHYGIGCGGWIRSSDEVTERQWSEGVQSVITKQTF
jgi:hypothetical protein